MRRMTDRYPAVIVVHASFNPVHRQHIEMVIEARDRLEKAGYCVSKGILAITNQSRLVQKGVEAITDAHRLAALKYACDGIDWLVPEPRGVEYGSGRQLAEGLAGELREKTRRNNNHGFSWSLVQTLRFATHRISMAQR